MFHELDTVALNHDLPEHGLTRGDVGAVVHCYAAGAAYEVEFVTASGRTIAVATLEVSALRAKDASEILHVRELSSAA